MEPEAQDNSALAEPSTRERVKENARELVKPFTEHLEDLRTVLIKSIVAVAIVCGVCLFFTDDIVRLYERPLASLGDQSDGAKEFTHAMLRSLHPADAFMTSIKVVVVTGLILSSPIVFYFLWSFVQPGLKPREQKLVIPVFAGGLLFFLLGVAFCYLVVLRLCLGFFYSYSMKMNIRPEWSIDNYISFVSMMMLAFGVVFEMPVLSAMLAKIGLVSSRFLSSKRLHAYLIIAIVAGVITPPDVFSQVLLIVPMIGLYEVSIFVIKLIEKGSATR